MSFIYLASQSPRRRQLLDQLGVRYELLVPAPEEDAEALEATIPGELPLRYVERVTRAKLWAAQMRLRKRGLPYAPILCSDTTVVLGRRILGKPADVAGAAATLALLSGKSHRVLTCVALAWGHPGKVTEALATSTSRVRFAALSKEQIDRYVAGGEPFGKAGAYAIQSAAAAWIAHIEGSYSGIMGLPLFETAQLLKQAEVNC